MEISATRSTSNTSRRERKNCFIGGILIKLISMFKIPFLNSPKKDSPKHNLIIGLGNPGDKYKDTYHNVGFKYIDYLLSKNGLSLKKYKTFEYVKTPDLILVKPTTYMNTSGLPIKEALKFFKIKPEKMLVVHDDSDIPFGEYKISFDRGDAGHNGIKSIINHLKTNTFNRLRIGIRKQKGKASDFVLKNMNPSDLKTLDKLFSEIEAIYSEGDTK
ncbi:MAG: aminoacyl-tRNA hydrolase [Candidatus Colwellbacteria bacterium CG10_big_fil_rev_8_21_14_0_10_41_28]|uniref:Peptidyl-tRNA hydrolase n=1 Tax=Candidatus Colwellbacteria bacterium CG10_big_fil_rev_8_21_14_0_10_41_28 TaxID=1974539 RepID=A0A2H0VH36_9BACT|nr:MAG: aminoacyl-tRNA hydrolase [Candidatus Colwellbacteria bacterium CG10_big_fil_rev_8_21_14_0_10_41_28]